MSSRVGRLARVLVPHSLQGQMIVLLGVLVLVQIGISGIIYGSLVADFLADQIGRRALDIAGTVAGTPLVAEGVAVGDPEGRVQSFAETVRRRTGAEYVVVCDRAGLRLSHPDPDRIGEHFVGGDEERVLATGESYVSRGVGTLGPSLRGFVPIAGDAGEAVGFVAVGYLIEDVNRTIVRHQLQPRVFVFMMALVGLLGAVIIAGFFKRAILGLEPREIAALYRERSAMLETIREGVLAVDEEGRIRLANAAARRDLGLEDAARGGNLAGRPVAELVPEIPVGDVLRSGAPALDFPLQRSDVTLVGNVLPVRHEDRVVGVVVSFRRKDELERLARELSQVREYAELLRAQAHEHSNQLHTVAGLIQIGAHREALELILAESADYQQLVGQLADTVPHPLLSGLILGKMARAGELKVRFTLDPDSSLRDLPAHVAAERMVTILGNLLDNAFEAAGGAASPEHPPRVRLSMTDLGRDLVLEVEDSGPGVPDTETDHIFEAGVTTKTADGHGIGLSLVARHLAALGGHVLVGRSDLGGALFTVIIPKKEPDPS